MKRIAFLLLTFSLTGCYSDMDNAKCSFYGDEGSRGYQACRQQLQEEREHAFNDYFTAKDPNDPNAKCSYNGLFSQQCEPSTGW